ncbi:MAG: flagellar motor switch protein FliM, partial [Bdellovibrionota bacterium]
MNQVLTQAEVDALLSAVADGSAGAAANDSAPAPSSGGGGGEGDGIPPSFGGDGDNIFQEEEVIPYDLTNQDRVIRGRMPTLDIIYERFIRLFRMSLSNALRKIASISIISTDLLKFGEFINTLPIPSCMCIVRFESLHGPALLVFESKLAYALVDSFFGGTDRPYTKIEGKEFTRIELSIMNKVMDLAIKDLEEAWAPVHKAELSFVRHEVNPQFVG